MPIRTSRMIVLIIGCGTLEPTIHDRRVQSVLVRLVDDRYFRPDCEV
jgi:hypothetical protein